MSTVTISPDKVFGAVLKAIQEGTTITLCRKDYELIYGGD